MATTVYEREIGVSVVFAYAVPGCNNMSEKDKERGEIQPSKAVARLASP